MLLAKLSARLIAIVTQQQMRVFESQHDLEAKFCYGVLHHGYAVLDPGTLGNAF